MRISDWSSDVCSSDLALIPCVLVVPGAVCADAIGADTAKPSATTDPRNALISALLPKKTPQLNRARAQVQQQPLPPARSEEHTSELQSLMRTSYAVFCLNTKKDNITRIECTDSHES